MVFFLTFAVIFGTLVLQGLSLAPIIRWLGVVDDRVWEKEERRARLEANQAALARLRELAGGPGSLEKSALHRLIAEYEDRIRQLKTTPPDGHPSRGGLFSADYEQLLQETLDVERRTILELRNRRVINDEALRRIQRDIDLAEIRLRQDAGESSG
jgi:CPA1 family monovalent cation:H+ antiporter